MDVSKSPPKEVVPLHCRCRCFWPGRAKAVIAFTTSRSQPIPYSKGLYRQRNLIERMFARLNEFADFGIVGFISDYSCRIGPAAARRAGTSIVDIAWRKQQDARPSSSAGRGPRSKSSNHRR